MRRLPQIAAMKFEGNSAAMRSNTIAIGSIVSAFMLAQSGLPGFAADSAKGGKIAERWCSSCHATSPGQPSANADAPSFGAISVARKVPEITGFLSSSHPNMPDMALSREEISDIIAFMQSLAPPLDPLKPEPQKDNPPKSFRG